MGAQKTPIFEKMGALKKNWALDGRPRKKVTIVFHPQKIAKNIELYFSKIALPKNGRKGKVV